uniref:ABC1 atypical kinase-like domain-containing protein n=2 Tax=Chrysotila carterae TaxID=13221 RepID=A0A7S4EZP1_CHRCT
MRRSVRFFFAAALVCSLGFNLLALRVFLHGGHAHARHEAVEFGSNVEGRAAVDASPSLIDLEKSRNASITGSLEGRSNLVRNSPATESANSIPSWPWYLLGLVFDAIFNVLRSMLLIAPAVLGSALWLSRYLQVRSRSKPLFAATAASLLLLLLAERGGAAGAARALALYQAAAAAALLRWAYVSEGWRRALVFWRLVGPMIIHYKLVKAWGAKADVEKGDLDALYVELHLRYAPRVLQTILRLRGFYVKFGQVISVLDFIPEPYRKELAVLQSGVPPKPPEEVRQLISSSLGQSISEVFRELDEKPIGSASIGQVHRAILKDGRRVVVKVQYPEVRALFASDFAQLLSAASFWSPQAMGDLRECRAQFMAEFDFVREARVMRRIADNLARPFPAVAVPRPIAGLVSEHVLVMSELPGGSLLDEIQRVAQAYADAQGISVDDLKARMLAKAKGDDDEDYAGDAMPSRLKLGLFNTYVRTASLARSTGVALYNNSIGLFTTPMKSSAALMPAMVDVNAIIKQLCAVLGHQVLVDGLFSSDPHPGNVMLLPDGRLGLIDFGQAKQLSDAQRRAVALMVVAVASADHDAILKLTRATKFKTKRNDPKAVVRYMQLMWEGSLRELGRLSKIDPVEQTDGEMVMVRRAVILVRSLGAMMGCKVNMAKEWEELARQVLVQLDKAGRAGGEGGPEAGGPEAAARAAAAAKGVHVEIVSEGESAHGVRIRYDSGAPPLEWIDEYQHLVWRRTVRGGTLKPILKAYGEAAVVRVAFCAARAAAAMRADDGFTLQQAPTSAEEDDRLQALRALFYLAWGHASGAFSFSASAGHYSISAGLKSLKLKGPWAEMAKQLEQSPAVATEVRKYFPRSYFSLLEAEDSADVAPQMNALLDAISKLLEPLAEDDAAADAAGKRVIAALFGEKLRLEESPDAGDDGSGDVAGAAQSQQPGLSGACASDAPDLAQPESSSSTAQPPEMTKGADAVELFGPSSANQSLEADSRASCNGVMQGGLSSALVPQASVGLEHAKLREMLRQTSSPRSRPPPSLPSAPRTSAGAERPLSAKKQTCTTSKRKSSPSSAAETSRFASRAFASSSPQTPATRPDAQRPSCRPHPLSAAAPALPSACAQHGARPGETPTATPSCARSRTPDLSQESATPRERSVGSSPASLLRRTSFGNSSVHTDNDDADFASAEENFDDSDEDNLRHAGRTSTK